MESRISPIQKSQLTKAFKPQTKKATQSTNSRSGKSQLSRSKSRNLIISKKLQKNQKSTKRKNHLKKTHNPKVTNNFIFKVDAQKWEGLKMGYRFI